MKTRKTPGRLSGSFLPFRGQRTARKARLPPLQLDVLPAAKQVKVFGFPFFNV